MKEILKYGITLMVLTGLLSGILAFVFSVTEPRRIEIAEQERLRAVSEVLPGAGRFEEKDWYFVGYDENTGEAVGFAFLAKGEGYSSSIETMVGAVPHCGTGPRIISGIKIISQQETPGLGSRINEVPAARTLAGIILRRPFEPPAAPSRPWFQEQFAGKTSADLSLNNIDGITGATITTRAVIDSVKSGLEKLERETK